MFVSCQQEAPEVVAEIFQPKHQHEAYSHALKEIGLNDSALGKAWLSAAQNVFDQPTVVTLPFKEEFYVDASTVSGSGYKFDVHRGQRVDISLEKTIVDSTDIFLDVFRIDVDSLSQFTHIASLNDSSMSLAFESNIDAAYILRFQTELLRSGRYIIKINSAPALAFPVSGKTKSAIGSLFGAPRDAGRRMHHGIDIFAKRHTEIIASCDGYISSTKSNDLGGNVIWLKDRKRNQNLYYAHLESILVQEGDIVKRGDVLGTVGNSGNAVTTAPHLHYGLYSNGPIDPYHFVVETRSRYNKVLAKEELIGKTIRTKEATNMKVYNLLRRGRTSPIPKYQIAHIIGISGAYYRVVLPDDSEGYVFYDDIEELKRPIRRSTIKEPYKIIDRPVVPHLVIADGDNPAHRVYGIHQDAVYLMDDLGQVSWGRISS